MAKIILVKGKHAELQQNSALSSFLRHILRFAGYFTSKVHKMRYNKLSHKRNNPTHEQRKCK